MKIAIRHFPDRKRPCIVLEEGNRALILGYLTDRMREIWLRRAFNLSDTAILALETLSLYTLDEIINEGKEAEE